MANSLFPHDDVRLVQNALMLEVERAIANKKCLVAHAPTGLGKTAATLPIALNKALQDNLTVFFLTSRHTQHKIAIDTLCKIKEKHKIKIETVDIIGKKWMCLVPGIQMLRPGDFAEYCRKQKEEGKCEFYSNIKKKSKISVDAKYLMEQMKELSPVHIEELIRYCDKKKLCPYEISILLG